MAFQKVEVPVGSYIGWGTKPKQYVEGEVTDYDIAGGSDFAGNPCPLLEVVLTRPAASFTKDGDRTNYAPGETVLLTCGQVSLKKAVKKAELEKGNLVNITLVSLDRTANGTVKVFQVQVDRDHTPTQSAAKGDSADDDSEEPPF